MYTIKEAPDINFKSKDSLFKYLKENEKRIVRIKGNQVSKQGKTAPIPSYFNGNEQIKGLEGLDENYVYPIISVTNLFDSHRDVHFQKCFNKTVKEQQGKILYAIDHELKMNNIIAWEDELEMLVKTINMKDINQPYDMECDVLMFKIKRETILNCKIPSVVRVVEQVKSIANSIRMRYIGMFLAMNEPDNEEYKENYKYWLEYIDKIANKEDVDKYGYFWGVTELAIEKEGSMVVTPSQQAAITIYPNQKQENKNEPPKSTQTKIEAVNNGTSQINYCLI